MPKIIRIGGFRLVVFPNDHQPPHVHAIGPDWHVKIALGNCEEIRPRLIEIKYGSPSKRDLRKALQAVDDYCPTLWITWREFHG